MQKEKILGEHDFGTDCKDCERYQKLGDVCVIEHGKKFLWEYCRDFVPQVVLPDYRELMKTVKLEQADERRKLRDRREREKRKKLKERLERKAQKKKERRARLRRLREKKKLKEMKLKAKEAQTTFDDSGSSKKGAKPDGLRNKSQKDKAISKGQS